MKVQDVMTYDVLTCRAETNLADAAMRMRRNDCGALPVIADGQKVVGMITDRRVCKELAAEIAKTVERNAGEGWSFAAPESIHRKIVEQLPAEIRERIVEHVESDLVKLPAATGISSCAIRGTCLSAGARGTRACDLFS